MHNIENRKYVVVFGDGSYGQIMTVGGKKTMGSVKSSSPDALNPSKYTLDEAAETGLSNLRFVRNG